MDSIKKMGVVAATGAALMSVPALNAEEKTSETGREKVTYQSPSVPNPLWNGIKKVCGFPYQETEYWNENETPLSTVKSTAERGLWGLWTYKEDSYGTTGNREETRYFKGNKENRKEEFENGTKIWSGEIKDGHPVGRVKWSKETQSGEFFYNQKGQLEGLQREFDRGILRHEFNCEQGKKSGEERFYDFRGSLERTVPWYQDKKNGVEQNLTNGDFTTYKDNVKDGPFKESAEQNNRSILERQGYYDNGIPHIQKEKLMDSVGHILRETQYDKDGLKHGEEREGDKITPYEHGVIHGVQIDGASYITYNRGKQEGAYRSSHAKVADGDLMPYIYESEEGRMEQNGEKMVFNRSFTKLVQKEDGSFGSMSLTEEQANEETKKILSDGRSMKDILKSASNGGQGKVNNIESKQVDQNQMQMSALDMAKLKGKTSAGNE